MAVWPHGIFAPICRAAALGRWAAGARVPVLVCYTLHFAKLRDIGSGLGLAISRQILEAHGATWGASSEPGHGTVFWFEMARRLP